MTRRKGGETPHSGTMRQISPVSEPGSAKLTLHLDHLMGAGPNPPLEPHLGQINSRWPKPTSEMMQAIADRRLVNNGRAKSKLKTSTNLAFDILLVILAAFVALRTLTLSAPAWL